MRGADFPASPTFDQLLDHHLGDRDARRADLRRRRRAVIDATTTRGDVIDVPANASRDLVDDVKACGRKHRFCALDARGAPVAEPSGDAAAVWVQTIAGAIPPMPHPRSGPIRLIDAGDTVAISPSPNVAAPDLAPGLDTTLLVSEQQRRYRQVATGLVHAAGLPLMTNDPDGGTATVDGAVPTGVVVQLPAEADPITFIAYARAELTCIDWLPLRRPLHPQARQHLDADQLAESAHHLARLLIIPIGPTMTEEEIGHAVLGITKTAEYTGWRWLADHEQVRWYRTWLVERYGPDHEAYRPAFTLPGS